MAKKKVEKLEWKAEKYALIQIKNGKYEMTEPLSKEQLGKAMKACKADKNVPKFKCRLSSISFVK